MNFHVVTGLPRSGSTLVCNILNQNPNFYASSTSPVPQMLNSLVFNWSSSAEVKGLLEHQHEETELRMENCARNMIDGWYSHKDKNVIFDKSRGWSSSNLMLNKVYPDAKMIVCVRNLLNVFASVEKQHRKNPLLDEAENLNDRTVFTRADKMFGPEGLIGQNIVGVEDLIRRSIPSVMFIQYEMFVRNPKSIMERLYSHLEEDYFDHNFDNVENTSEDADGFYLHKFPHNGSGKVEPPEEEEWPKYISPDLAQTIRGRFQDYCQYFGYLS